MQAHERFMRTALSLARRHLGQTWPNPSVGALVVRDGRIIGSGVTAPGGRPHAEPQALTQAGEQAFGATLYVTLEPCSHHGQTPPCTRGIIEAGISRVIIACRDPNPAVNGQGIAQLTQAGIEVIENVCKAEAQDVNRGFFSVIAKGRPFIALKLATSLDGKIAYPPGGPRWITGDMARRYGQLLRSRHDAIATGIGTVLADDPLLTCRLPGLENRSPLRIVFDAKGRLPASSQLVKTAKDVPVWAFTRSSSTQAAPPGIRAIAIDSREDGIDIEKAVAYLAQQGVTRLMVEAGAKLSSAFLAAGLVDRLYWFRAPVMIGEGGLPGIGGIVPAQWNRIAHRLLPPDILEVFECSPASSVA